MPKLVAACLAVLALVAAPLAARAQGPEKRLPRIGVLGTAPSPQTEVVRQALRELGWVEGRTVAIEWRWSHGRPELYAKHAAEFVRLGVDVILAPGSAQTEAARQATRAIPIVFTLHDDPVGVGHVASLARPGENVTGVAQLLTEVSAKQLEVLKETLPAASRVGVLWNPAFPSHRLALMTVARAGATLGVESVTAEARTATDFDDAFATFAREHVDAVLVLTATIFIKERGPLAELALRYRLPTVFASRVHAEDGGLLSYGPRLDEMLQRAAVYLDRVLRGRRPADLPVEQPTTFELVVNRATARTLGLAIPRSVLLRADAVIE